MRATEPCGGAATDSACTEQVFAEFYDQTITAARALACRTCGDQSEANDVCQDAYTVVYRYWRSGRLRESPRRLLFRVTQRGAVDVVRARSRRQRLSRRIPGPDESGPWLGIDVRDALRRLGVADATVLWQRGAVGLSYEEIAATNRESVAAIRSRLYRARKEFARLLATDGATVAHRRGTRTVPTPPAKENVAREVARRSRWTATA